MTTESNIEPAGLTPETRAIASQIDTALQASEQLVIDSPEMYEIAGEEAKAVNRFISQLEEQRLSMTRPLDHSKRRIMDFFRGPTDKAERILANLRRKMVGFDDEQRRQREEAERKARAEAEAEARRQREEADRIRRETEAKARAEREEIERQQREAEAAAAEERRKAEEARQAAQEAERKARAAGDAALAAEARQAAERAEQERQAAEERARREREAAAARQADADAAAAAARVEADAVEQAADLVENMPVATGVADAGKVKGTSRRTTWKADVHDLHALIRAAAAALEQGDTSIAMLLAADTAAINQRARSMRNAMKVPGIRVYDESSIAFSRR